jgi:hypothetical protein
MLDGRQPVAGEGWGPGARPTCGGDHGRGPRRPGTRVAVAGWRCGGAPELARQLGIMAGPRSWPASLVILVGGPRRPRFPSDRLPVAVRLGAGARPPAGVIMAGGLRRPRRWPQWVLRLVFVEIKWPPSGRPETERSLRRINKELGFTLFKQIRELDLITAFHSDFFRC